MARHWKEREREVALAFARLPEAQADRRRRRYLMEGSFAHAANRYHFKRSRWRRLWRQQIQDWIIAAVQNIALLCGRIGAHVAAILPKKPRTATARAGLSFVRPVFGNRGVYDSTGCGASNKMVIHAAHLRRVTKLLLH